MSSHLVVFLRYLLKARISCTIQRCVRTGKMQGRPGRGRQERTFVAAPQRGQAAPQQSQSKVGYAEAPPSRPCPSMGLLDMVETYPELCLCVRLALPFLSSHLVVFLRYLLKARISCTIQRCVRTGKMQGRSLPVVTRRRVIILRTPSSSPHSPPTARHRSSPGFPRP